MKKQLPHDTTDLFLTDGGLETSLIYLEGFDLPYFAAFDLLKTEAGTQALNSYYRQYLNIAQQFKTGFILESPTWRANPDWIEKLDYPAESVVDVNTKSVQLLLKLKEEFRNDVSPVLISGYIGPRGDGYVPGKLMSSEEAFNYHLPQVTALVQAGADLVSAITMNYVDEAIGIAKAASIRNAPVVISFTVETDGKLADGTSVRTAIEMVDGNVDSTPAYYMINCAHPKHFTSLLEAEKDEKWTQRIKGIRANASCKSHAELDESTTLDRGDIIELAKGNRRLREMFPHINVFGGCCGTDTEHIESIAKELTQ